MPSFKPLMFVGFLLFGPVAAAAGWLDARLSELEAKRPDKLSPHQRDLAARIMEAARDYEGSEDDTFTLWIRASRRDDDTIFIESVAEYLWDTKSHVHLPLEGLVGKADLIHKPRHIGSVLILENPASDADIYRDHRKLDGVIDQVLREGHFAVVLFVDDRNVLERLSPILTERMRVVDLIEASPCAAGLDG